MRKENSSNYQTKLKLLEVCPILFCYDLIDGRWKTHVLWSLREKDLRFSEIRKAIPLATERMVARRISELLESGLISVSFSGGNKSYSLTREGKILLPLLGSMMTIGEKFSKMSRKSLA